MRQFQKLTLLILGVSLGWLASSCSTLYSVENFDKVKINMSKDDVLEAVGSPTRTERIDGKDKWAYRFYTDDDRDSWDYRQATFFNGKVISAGVDTAEIERLKAIRADDQGREDRRKAFASRPADPANGKADAVNGITPAVQKDNVPEPRIPTESDFVDVKGKSGPTDSASDK